ncbi:MAG: hypothetical protein IPM34_13705 [Saprospiraceae bacterium]|nr:hypothetical protein [Saprospiraceae bacterium]
MKILKILILLGLSVSSFSQISLMIEWPPTHPTGCMQRILAKDDSLGQIRNLACTSEALPIVITNYSKALASLDFKYCPENFTSAFNNHRNAWESLIPFLEKYADKRDEMHLLFKEIESGEDSTIFKQKLKAVWDSWAEVEKAFQQE